MLLAIGVTTNVPVVIPREEKGSRDKNSTTSVDLNDSKRN
jgi:hypothetical protein